MHSEDGRYRFINGSLYERNASGKYVHAANVPQHIRKIEDAIAWFEGE